MPDDLQAPKKSRTELWLVLAAVILLLVLIFVPPFISLNHYQTRVTQAVAAALGRPVRLSSVELRLLPRPGFLLTDLTVQEDPAYGSEPVLHAGTVKAAIRFSSLWRGKLQISRISVDEASLNLVHMADGQWNLDSLFRNAAAGARNGSGERQQPPYLEATNSRINIKNGIEKLPFSILNADASMWRESNGDWRVRLRGQPARTDVVLDLADTGIVRMEATLHPAPQLNQMPLHVDIDWRQAQLGQLSRLLLSSDEGWRGDMTGELHLDGTAASAKVQSRLRASGVHRAEFAPAAPLDFDATCSFTLQFGHRSVENLVCKSPVGEGSARLTGDLPAEKKPRFKLELDRVPAQAGLDLLRTMRSNIDPSLQAAGSVSGQMSYDPDSVPAQALGAPPRRSPRRVVRGPQPHVAGPLTGSFEVDGVQLSGESLSKPVEVAKMMLEPAPTQPGQPTALATSISVPAGGPTSLTISAHMGLRRFEVAVRGSAALPRLREFAHLAGSPAEAMLAQLAGEPAAIDLRAEGPWVAPADIELSRTIGPQPVQRRSSIRTNGTFILHDASWKSGFLANPVLIPTATLHIENGILHWNPVEFSYGPVNGTATVEVIADCAVAEGCPPQVALHFTSLDLGAVQVALLGAQERGTMLSTLLARLKPDSSPTWPQMRGTVTADTLEAGPFTFTKAAASMRVLPTGAEASSFNAGLLGGTVRGKASLQIGDKPSYKLDATFAQVNPAEMGQLAEAKWTGGSISGNAKLELTGYTDQDLTQSAKGTIHFDWRRGAITDSGIPAVLSKFDDWTGDAAVADGSVSLDDTRVQKGIRKTAVQGKVKLGTPADASFQVAEAPQKVSVSSPVK